MHTHTQVGDSNVGKTSILLRFTDDAFQSDVKNTVGVDLKIKQMKFRDKILKLTIWDTGEVCVRVCVPHESCVY